MKNTAIDVTAKIIALIMIFIAPIIYLAIKFGGSETHVIEVTTNSMPITILLLISLLVLVFIAYLGSATMNAINDHPFGYGGIYMYGVIIGGVAFLGLFWINKVDDLVNFDTTQFLNDLATYRSSIHVVLSYIVIGLVIATAGFIYKKTA